MPFYISPERAVKLVERFFAFERDRALVHQRMKKYRTHVSPFSQPDRLGRDALRELFRDNAPDLRHSRAVDPWRPSPLPDDAYCWKLSDVAVIFDRSASTLSRTLAEISCRKLWRNRLNGLQRTFPASRAVCYSDGVFDMIIDFYCLSYLERFMTPRTGTPMPEAGRHEILAFWRFMSEHSFMSEEQFLDMSVPPPRPAGEIVPEAGPWADQPQKLREFALRFKEGA